MVTESGYQQGDVVMMVRSAVPGDAKPVAPGARGYVLAEGEATGHAHVIEATPDVEVYERDGVLWIKVADSATVTHEEHLPQTLSPGVYEVRRVVEVDPFEDEVRAVMD